MEFTFDPDSMEFGDLEDFEDYVGRPFDEAFAPRPVVDADGNRVFDAKGRPEMAVRMSAKAQTCLVWLVGRKTDPGFSIEDARRTKVTSLVLASPPERDRGNG